MYFGGTLGVLWVYFGDTLGVLWGYFGGTLGVLLGVLLGHFWGTFVFFARGTFGVP